MTTKRLIIVREETGDQGTFGFATVGTERLHTIELPWRDNARGMSCIPPGLYNAVPVRSPRFGKVLYRLDDKQTAPRSAILIHAGNWAGDRDKGWFSNFDGCIGLGRGRGILTPARPNSKAQEAITSSGWAMTRFEAWAASLPIEVEIIQDY